jgi:hypothetical protein
MVSFMASWKAVFNGMMRGGVKAVISVRRRNHSEGAGWQTSCCCGGDWLDFYCHLCGWWGINPRQRGTLMMVLAVVGCYWLYVEIISEVWLSQLCQFNSLYMVCSSGCRYFMPHFSMQGYFEVTSWWRISICVWYSYQESMPVAILLQ